MKTFYASGQILRYAAEQNQAIAYNLSIFASRLKEFRIDPSLISENFQTGFKMVYKKKRLSFSLGILILIAGLVAIGFVVGPDIYYLITTNWNPILLSIGSSCVGSGFILLLGRIDKRPLKNTDPPDGKSNHPLTELEALSRRIVFRLNITFYIQLCLICIVAALLLFVVLWSIILITKNKMMYATAFGSSGICMLIISKWVWKPIDRLEKIRQLTNDADALAVHLLGKINNVSNITNPEDREKAEQEALCNTLIDYKMYQHK